MRRGTLPRGTFIDIQLVTLELKLLAFADALERRYAPDQPRVPAGNADGGQWTDGGSGFGGTRPGRPSTLVAQGYGVNLTDEPEAAHIISEHVGRSPTYLAARLRQMLADTTGQGNSGAGLAVSSFPSLEAAQKLVNSTLGRNGETVAAVARGDLPGAILDADFAAPTGYEQYAISEHAQLVARTTHGVRVVIRHDPSQAKGFAIVSAYPSN